MEADVNLDQLIIDSKDKNIILFSNYRTGSTAFGLLLESRTGKKYFPEAFHPQSNELKLKLLAAIDQKNNVILSIMPDQIEASASINNIDNIIAGSYLIKLTRNDIVAQIASNYIAERFKKYSYYKGYVNVDYEIPIDRVQLHNTVSRFVKLRSLQNLVDVKFDLQISYESIEKLLNSGIMIRTPKPVNMQELTNEIRLLYNSYNLNG